AFAIMSALYHKERTGEGQFIDVSLLDSIMPLMGWVAANLMIGDQQPELLGNDNFTAAPSGTFITKDGYINIAANKQEQWEAVADVLGVPELKEDPRFKERDVRKKNRFELTPLLEEKLREKPTDYWVETLNKAGVPSGAILKLAEALSQPQVEHRNTFSTINIESIGEVPLFNMTAKFGKTPGYAESAPPELSQHTVEILTALGYGAADIRRLQDEGVI
ncbi:MAG: CaiB/BaiF CoA transferase family protein, partial [Bacteroidota bacterium]